MNHEAALNTFAPTTWSTKARALFAAGWELHVARDGYLTQGWPAYYWRAERGGVVIRGDGPLHSRRRCLDEAYRKIIVQG